MNRLRGWLLVVATAAAVASACSHQIESPAPTGSRAEPDLVCNAKPVDRELSTVKVHGSNFTPMPSKVLEAEDSARLLLPKIELAQVKDLAGNDLATSQLVVADDPTSPETSLIKWHSEQLMTFDVRPENNVPEGVYTIRITNPDGSSATTIEAGLAVLPPPIVSELKPPAICDDQADQTVEIVGANFLKLSDILPTVTVGDEDFTPTAAAGCTQVVGNFIEPSVELCTSLTIVIPQSTFATLVVDGQTSLPVVVTNPPPADCASSAEVSLIIQPPPRVEAVVPSTVCEGGSALTIHGGNFLPDPTVELHCPNADPVQATSATASNDGTTIQAIFGALADVGADCELIVTNTNGCQDRPLPHQAVTVVSGPILFYVDPSTVYNGINTQITLFVTTITPPLAADSVKIVPAGQTEPVIVLEHSTVPNYPNRLQALVPAGTPAGTYDIQLSDGSSCFTLLANALTVTDQLTVTLLSVNPSFGWTEQDTAIEIFRDTAAAAPANAPFVATPRIFLNPAAAQAGDIAVEVESVSFRGPDNVTGIVPAGTPAATYDVVLVNPDGSVGILDNGYTEVQDAPPVIDNATPASIPATNNPSPVVVLAGRYFDADAVVEFECRDSSGAPKAPPTLTAEPPICDAEQNCTIAVTVNASSLAAGDVCVVRLTNPDDGAYAIFSAIGVTTPSLNLNDSRAGTNMNVPRRALASAAGKATPAARFVYAVGGDDGSAAGALDTTEFSSVGLFGDMGGWSLQKATLGGPRTMAKAVTVGRYIYLVGGDSGAGPVATAERALILSPRETPIIRDIDLKLQETGLAEGEYHYRVSAVFTNTDLDNPGGESLPSDAFSLKAPTVGEKLVQVTLVWSAPLDSLGEPLPNVAGYRIYRTPAANAPPGTEVLLASINEPATLVFTDDGSLTPGTDTPLPLGSTGNWAQLAAMATPRSGLSLVSAVDPVDPQGSFYVYAFLGATAANTATGTYEFLPVDVAENGRQVAAGSWTPGNAPSAAPRWQAGAWAVDSGVTNLVSGADTYIYLGGGLTGANTAANEVEAARVLAGGQLENFDQSPADFNSANAGYGAFAGSGQLFIFGGGPNPVNGGRAARIVGPMPALANNSWNNEGLQMAQARYLHGTSVQSAFIFLLGGQTASQTASATTESLIW